MIQFRDFVPQMTEPPRWLKPAEYEDFASAVAAASDWIEASELDLLQIETVVLPNIWSRHEDGSTDPLLGTPGGMPSHWHQFVRIWYRSAGTTGEATD